MKRFLGGIIGAGLMLAALPGPVPAAEIDVSKMNCGEFTASGQSGMTAMMFWLDGFISGANNNPVTDFDVLAAATQQLVTICMQNPQANLFQAVDSLK